MKIWLFFLLIPIVQSIQVFSNCNGRVAHAIFNEDNDRRGMYINTNMPLHQRDFTVSLWAKRIPDASCCEYETPLIHQYDAYGTYGKWKIYLQSGSTNKLVFYDSNSGNTITSSFSCGSSCLGWHLYTFVVDVISTTCNYYLYADGNLVGSLTNKPLLVETMSNLTIGCYDEFINICSNIHLAVDDVSIWSTAFSQSIVTSLYTGTFLDTYPYMLKINFDNDVIVDSSPDNRQLNIHHSSSSCSPCRGTPCQNDGIDISVFSDDKCVCQCPNYYKGLACEINWPRGGPTTDLHLDRIIAPDECYWNFGYHVASNNEWIAVTCINKFLSSRQRDVLMYTQTINGWELKQNISIARSNVNQSFGASLAMDKTNLVVGVPQTVYYMDNLASDPSSIKVYIYDLVNGRWILNTTVSQNSTSGYGFFSYGIAIALRNKWLIIGCPYCDGKDLLGAGRVYVYRYETSWKLHSILDTPSGIAYEWYGRSLYLDSSVTYLVVSSGAQYDYINTFIYKLSDDQWIHLNVDTSSYISPEYYPDLTVYSTNVLGFYGSRISYINYYPPGFEIVNTRIPNDKIIYSPSELIDSSATIPRIDRVYSYGRFIAVIVNKDYDNSKGGGWLYYISDRGALQLYAELLPTDRISNTFANFGLNGAMTSNLLMISAPKTPGSTPYGARIGIVYVYSLGDVCPALDSNVSMPNNCRTCDINMYVDSSLSARRCLNCPDNTISTPGSSHCWNCPSGTIWRNYKCEPCALGTYSASGDQVCTKCPKGTYGGGEKCTPCDPSTFGIIEGSMYPANCAKCPDNSNSVSSKGSSCICNEGYASRLSFNGNTTDTSTLRCEVCPSGFTCFSDGHFEVSPGYWSSDISTSSSVFEAHAYVCPSSEACVGGGNSSCLSGYTGPVCGVCQSSYYFTGSQCNYCTPANQASLAILIIFGIIIAGICLWLLKRMTAEITFTGLKRAIMFGQIVSTVVTIYSIPWPSFFVSGVEWCKVLLLDLVSIGAFDCYGRWSFYDSFLFAILVPTFVIVVIYIFYAYLHFYRQEGQTIRFIYQFGVAEMKNRLINLVALILILIYPNISSRCLNLFHCRRLLVFDDSTFVYKQFLYSDYSIECSGSIYIGYSIVSGFLLLTYSVGFPIGLYYYLNKKLSSIKKVMEEKQINEDIIPILLETDFMMDEVNAARQLKEKKISQPTLESKTESKEFNDRESLPKVSTDSSAKIDIKDVTSIVRTAAVSKTSVVISNSSSALEITSAGATKIGVKDSKEWSEEQNQYMNHISHLISLLLTLSDETVSKLLKLRRRVGFWYADYSHDFFYWEAVDMVRKLFLIGVIVFCGSETTSQILLGLFACVTYHLIFVAYSPMKEEWANRIENGCLVVLWLNMLVGLGIRVNSFDHSEDVAFSIVILILNICMLLLAALTTTGKIGSWLREQLDNPRSIFVRGCNLCYSCLCCKCSQKNKKPPRPPRPQYRGSIEMVSKSPEDASVVVLAPSPII